MISTKTRALYQRRKGPDLFDLWLVLTSEEVSPEEIVAGLRHYMNESIFTYPQLRQNLIDKLADAGFRTDIEPLVVAVSDGYNIENAADLVMEQVGRLSTTRRRSRASRTAAGAAWHRRAFILEWAGARNAAMRMREMASSHTDPTRMLGIVGLRGFDVSASAR